MNIDDITIGEYKKIKGIMDYKIGNNIILELNETSYSLLINSLEHAYYSYKFNDYNAKANDVRSFINSIKYVYKTSKKIDLKL